MAIASWERTRMSGLPSHASPEAFDTFGALLRFLRMRARLSQRDLAIAVGYSEAHLSRLEQGQRRPDPDAIRAHFLDVLEISHQPEWVMRLLELAYAEHQPAVERAPVSAQIALPAANNLLLTRLHTPQLRNEAIERSHLLARLDQIRQVPLTLIAAPAGFGKTTLISAWLHRHRQTLRHAWLSLDPGDRDPALFVRYLTAALRTVAPEIGAATLAMLEAQTPPPVATLLTPLLNDLAALHKELVLVLDDYHAVASPPIDDALDTLVEHLPPHIHLVLTTRIDPALSLSRLRARGRLLEIRAADLRFSYEEAAAFLRTTMALQLSEADAAALATRTEGWAAGLQLAAVALRTQPNPTEFVAGFAGNNTYVIDYLAEEVLSRLPAHLYRFLLHTSILERLSGPLCDAVLGLEAAPGDSYSRLLLLELERLQLFLVPLDNERRWYRYHHLFVDVLRARLRESLSSAQIQELYRRAAAAEPSNEQAIEYLLEAGVWDVAAERIATLGPIILAQGNNATIDRWIGALPSEHLAHYPHLEVLHGITTARQGQLTRAGPLLEHGLAGAIRLGDQNTQAAALNELAVITLIDGDLPRSISYVERALQLAAAAEIRTFGLVFSIGAYTLAGRPDHVSANADELFRALRYVEQPRMLADVLSGGLSLAVFLHDHHQQLEQLARRGLSMFGDTVSLGRVGAEGALAHLAWLRGDLAVAEAQADETIALSAAFGSYDHSGPQMLSVKGIVAAAQGDLNAATTYFRQATDIHPDNRLYLFAMPGQLYALARIAWQQGRIDRLHTLHAQIARAGRAFPPLGNAIETLTRGLLALCAGDEATADSCFSSVAATEDQVPMLAVFASAHPLRAHLALQRNRPAEAAAALKPLLAACARHDTPGRLLLEAPYIYPLLQNAVTQQCYAEFAAYTLSLGTPPVGADTALPEPLTAREREVLHLLAEGYSNQMIADRMVISVGTAKRHVANICAKLAVESRLAAVARARELGLIR